MERNPVPRANERKGRRSTCPVAEGKKRESHYLIVSMRQMKKKKAATKTMEAEASGRKKKHGCRAQAGGRKKEGKPISLYLRVRQGEKSGGSRKPSREDQLLRGASREKKRERGGERKGSLSPTVQREEPRGRTCFRLREPLCGRPPRGKKGRKRNGAERELSNFRPSLIPIRGHPTPLALVSLGRKKEQEEEEKSPFAS